MSLRFAVLCLLIFTFATPVLAAKNAWRQCGIGAMVFPQTGWAAVTSNMIWDLGTTATTSSSSSESQCAGRASTAAKYIHQNFALLEEETATGSGAHLSTVLNILDCKNSAHDKIIHTMRSRYSQELNAGQSSGEVYFNGLINIIEGDFSSQCQTT